MVNDNKNLSASRRSRPPIVVVMGHIDHGKTTLLDFIRKSSVAAKESGGITQHIGAYEVKHGDKQITFLDTPGHEAFGKMRSRGARVADIAILMVAADDSVKPQTKEALEAIKNESIPFAVAINKIDKPNADIERTKHDLADAGVYLEGRGGNVPFTEISAKQGTGVDQLLETVLLLAELENIAADQKGFASGVVIESHLDAKRGITSTLLLRSGVIKKGEYAAAGDAISKVRILENSAGAPIDSAGPSSPVVVVGFDKLPPVGAEFKTFFSQKEAMDAVRISAQTLADSKKENEGGTVLADTTKKFILGVVIKSDVLGSAEAIEHELEKLKNERFDIKILRAEAGDVAEGDVKMAASSPHSLIIAFKTSVPMPSRESAKRMNVEIAEFEIIYEITDWLKKKIDSVAPKIAEKIILGRVKILKIFKSEPKGQVIGGKVLDGSLKRGAAFDLLRREKKISEGEILNLQEGRINASEVAAGNEFGALATSKISIAEGDVLEVFE